MRIRRPSEYIRYTDAELSENMQYLHDEFRRTCQEDTAFTLEEAAPIWGPSYEKFNSWVEIPIALSLDTCHIISRYTRREMATPNWQHNSGKAKKGKGVCKGVIKARKQALQSLKAKLR